jgi:hypothetical protein
MDTKEGKLIEAIEFVERYRYARNSKTDEVISLLQDLFIAQAEGEKIKDEHSILAGEHQDLVKYKKMWEELLNKHRFEILDISRENVVSVMGKLEQKYFSNPEPQPVKRVIQIEVEGTTNQIDWVKGYITNFIGEKIDNHDNFNQFSEGDIKVNIKESQ